MIKKISILLLVVVAVLGLSFSGHASYQISSATGEVWVGDPAYGSTIQAAITTLGGTPATLHVPAGVYNISSNYAIPANITLKPERGAVFSIATGVTLTINGPLDAGLYQIFSCTGTGNVVFMAGTCAEVVPQWWGAVGTTNDTAIVQLAINAAKSHGLPLYFPTGNYNVTASLNFTKGPQGWKVYGAGKQTSVIVGTLSAAYPICDFTGTGSVKISDLEILGRASGSQSAGLLLARENTSGLGDVNYISNIKIDGTFSKVGFANISSDLMTVDHCELYSSTSCMSISDTDELGVGSAYRTFATVTGNTLYTIRDSVIVASQRACLVYYGGAAITLSNTFGAIVGSATSMVELDGIGGQNLYMYNCRSESNSTASATSVVNAVNGSTGGMITGSYMVQGGPYINIAPGKSLSNYIINMAVTNTALKAFAGGGNIRTCYVTNGQNLAATLGNACWNNIVSHTSSSIDWFAASRANGYSNVQLREVNNLIDSISIGGGGVIKNVINTRQTWAPGSIANGASASLTMTISGVNRGDRVTANYWQIRSPGWFISATATANNTVVVNLLNETGGAVNLGSGPLIVTILQF